MTSEVPSRYTSLRDKHEALGASFTDFGGWQMPVRYTSDLAEHHAVRNAAGIFDISHMAEFLIEGSGAADYLDRALASKLSALAPGKAKYTFALADDGTIIDDLIVYRLADERYLIIANAGNRANVAQALAAVEASDTTIQDITDDYSLIAVQGPNAEQILAATPGIEDVTTPWDQQKYYAWAGAAYEEAPLLIARTGYTGEDGFELLIGNEKAGALWDAVIAAGEPFGLLPCGLAARDSLRLEAGMPLYGHELSRDTRPAQVGLGRVVAADKPEFVGKANIEPPADAPVLVGLQLTGKRAARAGYPVVTANGTAVGEVTSGALSPTLGYPVALAYLAPTSTTEELFVDVRGTQIPAELTPLPFYRRNS